MNPSLLKPTPAGLYCELGDFYVDPWKPVPRAVITHAHSDHARAGCGQYLCSHRSKLLLKTRLGNDSTIDSVEYGELLTLGGVQVSLHPAGHILGSAQVCIEHRGERVVVSGDYKRQSDTTCRPFEPVRCNTFVTESTFGLPIYRWPDSDALFEAINDWWKANQETGKASLLLAYSLGKAQRLLSGIDSNRGRIFTHGAVEKLNECYRLQDVNLPETTHVSIAPEGTDWSQSLIVAPPSALGTTWTRRFGKMSVAMASGWMQIRGTRRRRAMDRGFILSDHVDWSSLLQSIEETEAEEVWVTHGYTDTLVRYLNEQGRKARVVETEFSSSGTEEESDGVADG